MIKRKQKAKAQFVYLHSTHSQHFTSIWKNNGKPIKGVTIPNMETSLSGGELPEITGAHISSKACAQFCVHITLSKQAVPFSPSLGSLSPHGRNTEESSS